VTLLKHANLFALTLALIASVPATASTLCASNATTGSTGTTASATTGVSAPSLNTASCVNGTAVTIAVGNDTDNELVKWHTSAPNFPAGLDLGNLNSLNASVLFTADVSGDQPYYDLAFFATDNSLGAGTSGDVITLLENQTGNLSGGNLAMNANTTLFDAYDYSTGTYLLGGQSDTFTLAGLLGSDPSLSSDALYALDIGIGEDGGCSNTKACSESLTINSLSINAPAPTPEPNTVIMVGTGLLLMGSAFFVKQRRQLSLDQSI
jgi:hypothetical protein